MEHLKNIFVVWYRNDVYCCLRLLISFINWPKWIKFNKNTVLTVIWNCFIFWYIKPECLLSSFHSKSHFLLFCKWDLTPWKYLSNACCRSNFSFVSSG